MNAVAKKAALVLALLSTAPAAVAYEQGTLLTRFGYATVAPDAGSTSPTLPADAVDVDDSSSLGISLTYMLNPTLGVEVLGALPFTHDIVGNTFAAGNKLAETTHLPPTVTLQWYPAVAGKFQPYLGAGLNYTIFFDSKVAPTLAGAGVTKISLDSSAGLALQAGVDYKVDDKWLVNVAVWKIDIETTADLMTATGALAHTTDVTIDPLVYMIGAGYRF